MADCVKIQAFPSNPPAIFLDEGLFFIDLPKDFSQRLTKKLEQLTDINKFQVAGLLNFSFTSTPKNDWLLKHIILPNTLENTYAPLPVVCFVGSHTLRNDQLYVSKGTRNNYTCQLVDRNHWLPQIKDKYLSSLDLGNFVIDPATMASYMTQVRYLDTDTKGFNFPVAWYGNLFNPYNPNFDYLDLRPWFYSLYTLREIFTQHTDGWSFKCPVLETDVGRSIATYILDKDFLNSGNDSLSNKYFKAELENDFDVLNFTGNGTPEPTNATTIIFETEVADVGNNYDNITGAFTGHVISDFASRGTLNIKIEQDFFEYDTDSVQLELILQTNNDVDIILDTFLFEAADLEFPSVPYFLTSTGFSTGEGVPVLPGNKVIIRGSYSGSRGDIKKFRVNAGSAFWNIPRKAYYQEGDTVEVNQWIGKKYKDIDYLRGHAHLFNWKFETDYDTKTVTAYTPYEVEYYGTTCEGFFVDTTIDITDKVQCNSEETIIPKNFNIERYILLAFKKSTDARIKSLELPESNPLHSKLIDLGEHLKEETKPYINPFFETTYSEYIQGIELNNREIELAVLIDNNEEGISFDIGPRICIMDRERQWIENVAGDGYVPLDINILGQVQPLFLMPYNQSNAIIDVTAEEGPAYREKVLIYGEDKNSLYQLAYRRWFNATINNANINILAALQIKDYFKFSLRYRYCFNYFDRFVIGFISTINDFNTCSDKSTPISFFADKQTTSLLGPDLGGGDLLICDDEVTLIITKVGNDYNLSYDAQGGAAVNSLVYEWKYQDETAWTDITGNPTVSSPSRDFNVRLTIEFLDGCIYVVRQDIKPCENKPIFIFEYDFINACLLITIGGEFISTIDTSVIEYSDDGGNTWNNYNGCLTLDEEINYLFRSTITWLDGCADTDITGEYQLPAEIIDCESLVFGLERVDAGNETMIFNRTGGNIPNVAFDIIKWRSVDADGDPVGDGVYLPWDNITPVPPFQFNAIDPCRIEVVRILIFKNNVCPTLTSEPIILNCL